MKMMPIMVFRERCRWMSSKMNNTCQFNNFISGSSTLSALDVDFFRCFCVGVSTSFGIVTRFDRLMHAAKELVGEQYHIRGVGYISKVGCVETNSGDAVRPIHDV